MDHFRSAEGPARSEAERQQEPEIKASQWKASDVDLLGLQTSFNYVQGSLIATRKQRLQIAWLDDSVDVAAPICSDCFAGV